MRKLLVVLAALAVPTAAFACSEHDAQQAQQSPGSAPVMVAAKTKATKKPATKKPAKPDGKG